jgi:hypothetical protein
MRTRELKQLVRPSFGQRTEAGATSEVAADSDYMLPREWTGHAAVCNSCRNRLVGGGFCPNMMSGACPLGHVGEAENTADVAEAAD